MSRVLKIKEGSNYTLVVKVIPATTGLTLSVRAISTSATTDTSVVLASASGVAANTDVSFSLITTDLAPDDYYLEFFADYGSASQTVLNNGGQNVVLTVEDMGSVT